MKSTCVRVLALQHFYAHTLRGVGHLDCSCLSVRVKERICWVPRTRYNSKFCTFCQYFWVFSVSCWVFLNKKKYPYIYPLVRMSVCPDILWQRLKSRGICVHCFCVHCYGHISSFTDNWITFVLLCSWNSHNQMVWSRGRLQCYGDGITGT